MNFIEAALLLLQNSRRALTAEQLVKRAEKQSLLSRPGSNPQRSMKAALSRELRKDEDSRVVRIGEDGWKLAPAGGAASDGQTAKKSAAKKSAAKKSAAKKSTAKKSTAKKAASKKAASKKAASKKTASKKTASKKAASKKATAKKKTAGKKKTAAKKSADAAEDKKARGKKSAGDVAEQAETTKSRADAKGRKGKGRKKTRSSKAAPEPQGLSEKASAEVAAVLAPQERPKRGADAVLPSEADIEELYGEELASSEPGAAFTEYRDAQTDDEDRPMTPEIVARRDRQKRDRRKKRERGRRRDEEPRTTGKRRSRDRGGERDRGRDGERERGRDGERERGRGRAKSGDEAPAARPPAPRRRGGGALPYYRLGTTLGDSAAEILASSRDGQPVQVKQIAQMMHKKQLLDGRPEETWSHLKAALLSDEASYRARGLRAPHIP